LEVVEKLIPRFGAEVIDTYSFPSFKENFSIEDKKISNPTKLIMKYCSKIASI
jgi:chromate reductase, NAD(P)H dehydrogenase (quinone)